MKFAFEVKNSEFICDQSELKTAVSNHSDIYYDGLNEEQILALLQFSTAVEYSSWFNNIMTNNFIVIIHDKLKGQVFAFNDKYGHQLIYITKSDEGTKITSFIPDRKSQKIDNYAVHEFLSFHSIIPPKTMYQGVSLVPIASYYVVNVATSAHSFERYWEVEKLFQPKVKSYNLLVADLQKTFYEGIKNEYQKPTAIALSGGIDSGGILGMLTECAGESIDSISYGPYGEHSLDLVSSRKTSKMFNSKNYEIYPEKKMLNNLFEVNAQLEQPISGDQLLATGDLYRVARDSGNKKIYFGYGTQMLLGNLILNRIWHRTRLVKKIVPRKIIMIILEKYAKFRKLSPNATNILLSNDWLEKFFMQQGALLSREKTIYKNLPQDFMEQTISPLQNFANNSDLLLSDRFILFYLFSWTNYAQERNNAMLSKVYGVEAFSPYNTPAVAEVILKTPDAFRKKNNWNKQLWRDALRPYIPEHLYQRRGKSLTVPYSKIFAKELHTFMPYIKESEILKNIIDFTVYEREFDSLPEPGLNLIRLISLAIWYDSCHAPERIAEIKTVFKDFDFDKKMAPYKTVS